MLFLGTCPAVPRKDMSQTRHAWMVHIPRFHTQNVHGRKIPYRLKEGVQISVGTGGVPLS